MSMSCSYGVVQDEQEGSLSFAKQWNGAATQVPVQEDSYPERLEKLTGR